MPPPFGHLFHLRLLLSLFLFLLLCVVSALFVSVWCLPSASERQRSEYRDEANPAQQRERKKEEKRTAHYSTRIHTHNSTHTYTYPIMSASTIDLQSLLAGNVQLKGADFDVASLQGKVVALYFSAHWCPPCRAFTPSLVKAYDAAKAAGVDFELIFVSSDQDDEGFDEYYATMSFPAVKFDQEEAREQLGAVFGVKGIPSLQVVGKDGKIIEKDGRSQVTAKGADAFAAWAKL